METRPRPDLLGGLDAPIKVQQFGRSMALYSPCENYRYVLTREWGDGEKLVVIGLNPSTATAEEDDNTIRRCIGFARRWSFGGLVMLNLFAFRAREPRAMMAAADPVGDLNDITLALYAYPPGRGLVAAWGTMGAHMERGERVRHALTKNGATLCHLGLTKDGHPKHPLYLPGTVAREPWV